MFHTTVNFYVANANLVIFSVNCTIFVQLYRRYSNPMKTRILHIVLLFLLFCLPAAAQKDDATVENLLMKAVELFANRNYTAAGLILENLSKEAPDNDAVQYYLGMVYAISNKAGASRECFEKAVALDPHNYWYKARLALIYKALGREDDMISLYEDILKEFPDKTEVSYELLSEYLRKGDGEKALKALDDIEAAMGPDEQITRTRYDIYMNMGRSDEALGALEKFNEEYSSPSILSMIGDSHLSNYEDSLALESYNEALSLSENYVPALLGKCEVYRTTGRTDDYFDSLGQFMENNAVNVQAKTVYLSNVVRSIDPSFIRRNLDRFDPIVEKCLLSAPQDSMTLSTAGMWYYSTDRREKGIGLLRENVSLHPESLAGAATYIQALSAAENWETLQKEAEAMFERFPKETAFLEYANLAGYNLKDYQSVIRNSERILETSKDSTVRLYALSSIGDMQHLLGNNKDAYKTYRKALKINPSYAPVLNNYAWYLCQEGKSLRKACAMSRKTIDSEPDNPTYLDTYGWILHLMGKDSEAKPVFKHALLYGGKDSVTTLDHYADVLFELGEYDLAKVYWYQAAAKNDPQADRIKAKADKKLKSVGK